MKVTIKVFKKGAPDHWAEEMQSLMGKKIDVVRNKNEWGFDFPYITKDRTFNGGRGWCLKKSDFVTAKKKTVKKAVQKVAKKVVKKKK